MVVVVVVVVEVVVVVVVVVEVVVVVVVVVEVVVVVVVVEVVVVAAEKGTTFLLDLWHGNRLIVPQQLLTTQVAHADEVFFSEGVFPNALVVRLE